MSHHPLAPPRVGQWVNYGELRSFEGTKRGIDVNIDRYFWLAAHRRQRRTARGDRPRHLPGSAAAWEAASNLLAAADEMDELEAG